MDKRMRTLSFPRCLLALTGILFVFLLLSVEASAQGVVTRKTPVSAKKASLRKSQGATTSQKKKYSQKKYFKVNTSFFAKTGRDDDEEVTVTYNTNVTVTYNTNGTCHEHESVIDSYGCNEYWRDGTYYMTETNASQKVLYVTWEGYSTEKYILSNGTYRNGNLIYRKASK